MTKNYSLSFSVHFGWFSGAVVVQSSRQAFPTSGSVY